MSHGPTLIYSLVLILMIRSPQIPFPLTTFQAFEAKMSISMEPNFLNLPSEIRLEIVIHYLKLSASNFEAPKGILTVPFDRPLLIFCDSKAEIGSIPLLLGENNKTTNPTVGKWSSFHLLQGTMNLMLVNKLLYNEVSSLVFLEFALIPPPELFRFVHCIPFLPNQNSQTSDLVRHLQLRISFSLREKGAAALYHEHSTNEDVARFQEFRDWFPGLRSVRFQINFLRGTLVVPSAKTSIVRKIMRCADVFQGAEVLLFVEPCGDKKGGTLTFLGGLEGPRGQIIKDIIEECRKELCEQHY
jgi:hypothetical protein